MKHLILLHGAIGSQDQLDPLAEMLSPHYVLHRLTFSGHWGMAYAQDFSRVFFLARRLWRRFNFAKWHDQYSFVLGVQPLMGFHKIEKEGLCL